MGTGLHTFGGCMKHWRKNTMLEEGLIVKILPKPQQRLLCVLLDQQTGQDPVQFYFLLHQPKAHQRTAIQTVVGYLMVAHRGTLTIGSYQKVNTRTIGSNQKVYWTLLQHLKRTCIRRCCQAAGNQILNGIQRN